MSECVLAWAPGHCVWSLLGFFFFFFLPLTHSGGHVAVDFKEAQTERGEGGRERGGREQS